MTDDPPTPLVLAPSAAAARLGVSVGSLVALVRHYRYSFTELALGGRPGDRGRGRWGMTEGQVEAVVRGQARAVAEPASTLGKPPTARSPVTTVTRIRYPKPRSRPPA